MTTGGARRRRRLAWLVLAGVLTGLPLARGAEALEKWGPFRGQVVDLETGEPIAGAVVVVHWWEDIPNPVQGQERFYDAREAVSGPDGRFEIPRRRPAVFAFPIRFAKFTIFAPGYKHLHTVVTPPEGERFIDPTVVQMRRLQTREERRRNLYYFPPYFPDSKMPKLLDAINRERSALGLGRLREPTPGVKP